LGDAVELGEFLLGGGAADGESFDLAEPAFAFGFGDAVGEVVADLDQPAALGRVGAQDRAADTGVFVLADGRPGACAGADGDLAAFEVAEEFLPLGVGGGAVLLCWAQRTAAGEERPVGFDCLCGVDGLVAERGGDVGVPADDLGDVWWQAVEDGFGDEDSSEVVGRNPIGWPSTVVAARAVRASVRSRVTRLRVMGRFSWASRCWNSSGSGGRQVFSNGS
jgi:hypothetical protein